MSYELEGIDQNEVLLVLATTITEATQKAASFLAKRADKHARVTQVKSAGLIDVF